jgi:hypothetical protein
MEAAPLLDLRSFEKGPAPANIEGPPLVIQSGIQNLQKNP